MIWDVMHKHLTCHNHGLQSSSEPVGPMAPKSAKMSAELDFAWVENNLSEITFSHPPSRTT